MLQNSVPFVLSTVALVGCSTATTPNHPRAQITAQSVEQELIQKLQNSAQELHEAAAALESATSTPAQRETTIASVLTRAQSLLDNQEIVRGCAKLVRYQGYEAGASYAKYECEMHYDKERLLQLGDALKILTWHPNQRAKEFAVAVVQDIRSNSTARAAAIEVLSQLATQDPSLAEEVATARSEVAARAHFYADNASTLSDLSNNLELCFIGRDRDLDVIFEVNPYGDIVRIHSPLPNSRLERCVIKYTLDEEFEMRTSKNLVFRIHVLYRSNV